MRRTITTSFNEAREITIQPHGEGGVEIQIDEDVGTNFVCCFLNTEEAKTIAAWILEEAGKATTNAELQHEA